MVNTYNQSPSPQQGSPSSIMKMTMWILTLLFVAQIIGTCFFGVYFYKRLDKMEEEKSFGDDYVFLKMIQKCKKGESTDTLLNCTKVLSLFHIFINEVADTSSPGIMFGKLKGDNNQPSTAPRVGERTNKTTEDNLNTEKVPVAIHLVGKSTNKTEVLQWMLKGYTSMSNQVTYTNGYFKVEVPGVYYVYSQVSFCINTKDAYLAPFVQNIFLRRQPQMDILLLKGANTLLSKTGDCALHSIKQGAAFTLRQNDLLFVNVTDSSRINYSPGLTYFGMFKL
ncbi:CD40 ligand [Pelobates fuscus]|uniref:CD40 ligand n=1 Tax=Pelobates fuscus TaxID=191477 RepID=UPI002FE4D7F3